MRDWYRRPRKRLSGFRLAALISVGLLAPSCGRSAVVPGQSGLDQKTTVGQAGHLTAVYFLNRSDGWVSFDSGPTGEAGLYRTTDGGQRWDLSAWPRFRLCQMYFFSPQDGWASGEETVGGTTRSNLLRTADGGRTWQVVRMGPVATAAKFVAWGGGRGWAIFGDRLLKTNNGGRSWDSVPMPRRNFRPTDLGFFSPQRGYVIGEVPDPGANDFAILLLATTDAGSRWRVLVDTAARSKWVWQGVFGGPDTARLAFADAGYGYYYYQVVGFRWGALHRIQSTRGGWKQSLPTQDLAGRATTVGSLRFTSPQVGWFSATGPTGGLLRTTDGGKDWQSSDLGPGWQARSLSVVGPKTAWMVLGGTKGKTVLKETRDGGRTWRQVRLEGVGRAENGSLRALDSNCN